MARSTPRRRAPKPRPWSRSRSATPPRAEQEPSTPSRTRVRLLAGLWFLLSLAGVAALVAARVSWGPALLADLGAVVVSTTYVWALAARTGGRPVVFALLSLAVGVAVVVADRDVLRNGAAVMTGTVAAILA
ncbi:MAG TPA: hypothetical protein VD814_07865, partial [Nocardioides sp.]|nr:hypothetical protein [Nocardioides sp.]